MQNAKILKCWKHENSVPSRCFLNQLWPIILCYTLKIHKKKSCSPLSASVALILWFSWGQVSILLGNWKTIHGRDWSKTFWKKSYFATPQKILLIPFSGIFRDLPNISDGISCKNSWRLSTVNYFH